MQQNDRTLADTPRPERAVIDNTHAFFCARLVQVSRGLTAAIPMENPTAALRTALQLQYGESLWRNPTAALR